MAADVLLVVNCTVELGPVCLYAIVYRKTKTTCPRNHASLSMEGPSQGVGGHSAVSDHCPVALPRVRTLLGHGSE